MIKKLKDRDDFAILPVSWSAKLISLFIYRCSVSLITGSPKNLGGGASIDGRWSDLLLVFSINFTSTRQRSVSGIRCRIVSQHRGEIVATVDD